MRVEGGRNRQTLPLPDDVIEDGLAIVKPEPGELGVVDDVEEVIENDGDDTSAEDTTGGNGLADAVVLTDDIGSAGEGDETDVLEVARELLLRGGGGGRVAVAVPFAVAGEDHEDTVLDVVELGGGEDLVARGGEDDNVLREGGKVQYVELRKSGEECPPPRQGPATTASRYRRRACL